MAVRLIAGSINRYAGLSTDEKPRVGLYRPADGYTLTDADLPSGSTYHEDNTGWDYEWNGVGWDRQQTAEYAVLLTVVNRLETVILEQRVQSGLFRDMLKPVDPEGE